MGMVILARLAMTDDSMVGKAERRLRDIVNENPVQDHLMLNKRFWQQLCSSMDVIGDTDMAVGSSKDGRNDTWRDKPRRYHLLKAIRHSTTYLMIVEGVIEGDGENHLKLAITRLSMALTQECNKKLSEHHDTKPAYPEPSVLNLL
jgi:hypothetical protein